MLIKKATNKDFPVIIELYKKGLDELGEKWIESCLVKKVVTSYHLAPCFLLEIDGIICGMVGLTLVHHSHNGDTSLAEYMFYIEPEHRNIKTLGALVKEAKKFASSVNIPLRFDLLLEADTNTKKRLFKMYGFKPLSVVGYYEPDI